MEIEDRVQNGIDALDAHFMGYRWFDEVNLDVLDMPSLSYCVLGQLDTKHNCWGSSNGLNYKPSLGFEAQPGEPNDFPKLQREWTKRIVELRSERA